MSVDGLYTRALFMPPILKKMGGFFRLPKNTTGTEMIQMLLEARDLKLYVKDRLLFDVKRLIIDHRDRIGLVGKNGSGKTTLLKTLTGQLVPDQGQVISRATVEFLPQIKRQDSTKSGGELAQEYLLQALGKDPEILFLDEPTTHLDTGHIEWLEKKLKNWPGAFVVVSHDREFLDTLCTTIWEIDEGKIKTFKGNYSDYVRQKELERAQQIQAYEKYAKKKRQLEEALRMKEQKAQRATKIPKNANRIEAKKAKPYFAKKQKKLEKAKKAMETRLEKLEKVEKPREITPVKMSLPHQEAMKGRVVIRVLDVSGMAGNKLLWKPARFDVRGGEKIAVTGPNGAGKTTLIQKIIRQDEGITVSPSVKIGYFSQNLNILDLKESILENVRSTSKQDETLIRTVLARLHFRRDDVYKKVEVLSGGERVKVALAKVFVSDINTLVLDEPTNFLDIEAVEALESLLQEYEGTVIFVTHDRRFVKKLATRILEIKNREIRFLDRPDEKNRQSGRKKERDAGEDRRLLLETKISEVLSRLSVEPSEELEKEFQRLLAEKKKLETD